MPKPKDIDAYLARIPDDHRAALQKLRRQILAAAPRATECIAWSMPAFRVDGHLVVCFGNAKKHVSLYPTSAALIEEYAEELAPFDTSRGTIRFTPAKPLPAALVKKLVRARLAENREKIAARGRPAKK